MKTFSKEVISTRFRSHIALADLPPPQTVCPFDAFPFAFRANCGRDYEKYSPRTQLVFIGKGLFVESKTNTGTRGHSRRIRTLGGDQGDSKKLERTSLKPNLTPGDCRCRLYAADRCEQILFCSRFKCVAYETVWPDRRRRRKEGFEKHRNPYLFVLS